MTIYFLYLDKEEEEVCSELEISSDNLLNTTPALEPQNADASLFEKIDLVETEQITAVQKQALVNFMWEHVEFARNELCSSLEGKITTNNLWEELSEILNIFGPPKSISKWQRVS